MPNHKSRAHALLSASSAHRWLHCPASATAEAMYEDQTSTFAEEGTKAHEVAEAVASSRFLSIDSPIPEGATSEMKSCAEDYADFIQERMGPGDLVFLEQRLDFSKWVPDGFGTGDCIILSDGKITVIDYKFGKGVEVSAVDNPQMMLYALGAISAYDAVYDFHEVDMCIFQPRIGSISSWSISVDDLLSWAENVCAPIAQRAANGSQEYNPGEHCRFCKHAGRCRALAGFCTETVEIAGENRSVEVLQPWEIEELLKAQPIIELWMNRLRGFATEQLMKGEQIPGWKLVEGRSSRAWSAEAESNIASDLKSAGFTEDEYLTTPELMSPAALEKSIGRKQVSDLLGKYIIRKPGKPTLAPESDKRPALSLGYEFKEEK